MKSMLLPITRLMGFIARLVLQNVIQSVLTVLGLIGLAILLLWALNPVGAPLWTGFGPDTAILSAGLGKTLWDWLELLILPLTVLLAISIFSRQRPRILPVNRERLAWRETVVESNLDTQESRLQAYIENLTHLLLHEDLRKATQNSEVRRLARAQLIGLLWGLDGHHKSALVRFLYESGLIKYPEPVLSLTGADLSSSDLSGMVLSGVDFRGVQLQQSDLSSSRLDRAQLSGADLTGATFLSANLGQAAPGSNGSGPANLSRATLDEAILAELDMSGLDLSNVSLQSADLTGTNLQDALLRGAHLNTANLSKANLTRTNMRESNLSHASLTRASLDDAILCGAILKHADLRHAVAKRANFRNAKLTDVDLRQSQLSKAYFLRSSLRDANLSGADLRGANLSGADLTGAKLNGADLRGAFLLDAIFNPDQLDKARSIEGAALPSRPRAIPGDITMAHAETVQTPATNSAN